MGNGSTATVSVDKNNSTHHTAERGEKIITKKIWRVASLFPVFIHTYTRQ